MYSWCWLLGHREKDAVGCRVLQVLCLAPHSLKQGGAGKGVLPFAVRAVTTRADRNYISETSADVSPDEQVML